jgi:hypothetical protein
VELITPFARFDKKIVLTKFNFNYNKLIMIISYSSSVDNVEWRCMQTICLDCTNRYYLGILCMPSVAHGLSIVNAKSVTQKTIPGDALFFSHILRT